MKTIIESSQNNDEFVKKMIDLFIKIIPNAIEEMNTAYHQQNFQTIYNVAHRIKPSVNHMGIKSLKEDMNTLERLANEEPGSLQIPILLNKISNILSTVISDLKKEYS